MAHEERVEDVPEECSSDSSREAHEVSTWEAAVAKWPAVFSQGGVVRYKLVRHDHGPILQEVVIRLAAETSTRPLQFKDLKRAIGEQHGLDASRLRLTTEDESGNTEKLHDKCPLLLDRASEFLFSYGQRVVATVTEQITVRSPGGVAFPCFVVPRWDEARDVIGMVSDAGIDIPRDGMRLWHRGSNIAHGTLASHGVTAGALLQAEALVQLLVYQAPGSSWPFYNRSLRVVRVSSCDTMHALAESLYCETGIPPEHQRLSYYRAARDSPLGHVDVTDPSLPVPVPAVHQQSLLCDVPGVLDCCTGGLQGALLVEDAAADSRSLQVFLRNLRGKIITMRVSPATTVEELRHIVQAIEGIPPAEQILTFSSRQLCDGRTLGDYNMQRDSDIDLRMRLRGTIGTFVLGRESVVIDACSGTCGQASRAPGAAWLARAAFISPLPPTTAVIRVVAAVSAGSSVAASGVPRDGLSIPALSREVCKALIRAVDEVWSKGASQPDSSQGYDHIESNPLASSLTAASIAAGSHQDDFKLLLSPSQLLSLIGAKAFAGLIALLGAPPDAIAVRRTQATGRWIAWHVDTSTRTVQVPLTSDDACVGGRLVYLGPDGAVSQPMRRAGVPLVHDGTTVHGVTALEEGVRYGLFLLHQ